MNQYQEIKRFAIVTAIIISVILVSVIILIGSEPPDSSIQVSTLEFVIATEVVHPSEDLVVSVGSVTLFVPSDAIDVEGSIAITTRAANLFSPAGEIDWSRPQVVNIEFRSSEGIFVPFVVLAKPARLCFKITQNQWLDYLFRPDEYRVQFYDQYEEPPRWESIRMEVDAIQNELCGETDHLSLFALAVKDRTSNPFTDANPTLPEGPYVP